MSLIGIHIEALLSCPKCSAGVPINGAADSLLCSQCQHIVPMPVERWEHIFGDLITEAASYEVGTGSNSTIMSDFTYKIQYGRVPPRCAQCKEPLADEDLLAAAPKGSMFCPGCGERVAVRPPPEWMMRVHPMSKLLVGETLVSTTVRSDGGEPVKLHCISCGAGLAVDGSTRNVPCGYCNESTYIPDKVWLRLHPASSREPWLVCLDIGDAVGMLPGDVDDFCDLAPGSDGNLLLAYLDEDDDSGEACHLVAVGQAGGLLWDRTDLDFSSEARFATAPGGGALALIDERGGYHEYDKPRFTFLDPATGATLHAVSCEQPRGDWLAPSKPRPPNVSDARAQCVDLDGTLLLLQYGDRERSPTLTRYAQDGTPLPLWTEAWAVEEPVKKAGFFARMFGSGGKATSDGLSGDVESARWGCLTDRLAVPPEDIVMGVGADGVLYLADESGKQLAAYGRSGRLRYERELTDLDVDEVHAVTADEDGTVYLLFESSERWRGDQFSHIARVRPDAPPELWLGVLAPGTPSLVGEYDNRLCIGPGGELVLGYSLDSLRIIDREGRTRWRSVSTTRYDRDVEKKLGKEAASS